jgi:hypothetical protein
MAASITADVAVTVVAAGRDRRSIAMLDFADFIRITIPFPIGTKPAAATS